MKFLNWIALLVAMLEIVAGFRTKVKTSGVAGLTSFRIFRVNVSSTLAANMSQGSSVNGLIVRNRSISRQNLFAADDETTCLVECSTCCRGFRCYPNEACSPKVLFIIFPLTLLWLSSSALLLYYRQRQTLKISTEVAPETTTIPKKDEEMYQLPAESCLNSTISPFYISRNTTQRAVDERVQSSTMRGATSLGDTFIIHLAQRELGTTSNSQSGPAILLNDGSPTLDMPFPPCNTQTNGDR
eukprot:TRINITY_DN8697_c0_g1_i1.p1 TRINITY_DN8697_c0_g1~~TRINITY_DN8697_c0_g1_i1.p1  ORF type:complete len:242 (+),score=6.77 TRINITY_DN8697_c0_g1_i1:90-815(+)